MCWRQHSFAWLAYAFPVFVGKDHVLSLSFMTQVPHSFILWLFGESPSHLVSSPPVKLPSCRLLSVTVGSSNGTPTYTHHLPPTPTPACLEAVSNLWTQKGKLEKQILHFLSGDKNHVWVLPFFNSQSMQGVIKLVVKTIFLLSRPSSQKVVINFFFP